jgi:hypothetical protein
MRECPLRTLRGIVAGVLGFGLAFQSKTALTRAAETLQAEGYTVELQGECLRLFAKRALTSEQEILATTSRMEALVGGEDGRMVATPLTDTSAPALGTQVVIALNTQKPTGEKFVKGEAAVIVERRPHADGSVSVGAQTTDGRILRAVISEAFALPGAI